MQLIELTSSFRIWSKSGVREIHWHILDELRFVSKSRSEPSSLHDESTTYNSVGITRKAIIQNQSKNSSYSTWATVMLVTTLWLWFYDGDSFKMLVTESLCWWLFSLCWWLFQWNKLVIKNSIKHVTASSSSECNKSQMGWCTYKL